MKILKRFKHATFASSVWYANHSATETWYNKMLEQFDKKIEEEENKFFYKCSFRAAYLAENFVYITDTFRSVVAASNADQKDPGS